MHLKKILILNAESNLVDLEKPLKKVDYVNHKILKTDLDNTNQCWHTERLSIRHKVYD